MMDSAKRFGRESTIADPAEDRAGEASARLVAETVPVGLGAIRSDGTPVFANNALARLLGYPDAAALVATPVAHHHAHPELALDVLGERIDGGHLDGVEMDLLRWDGEEVHVRINARALQVIEGEVLFVGSVEDITAPRDAQEESAHNQKMEAVARFAAGVAHDYNNLLTSILGETRQLLSGHESQPDLTQGLEAILRATRTASSLTQRLLVFAKSEVIRTDVLDLTEAVRGLESAVSGLLPEDIELVWRSEQHAGKVRIAPRHLEGIVAHLVTNARDAMPAGGSVVVETGPVLAPVDTEGVDFHPPVPHGRYASLAIGDRGIGMNQETRRKIFDPFFTTKPIGDGAGLGLTTVYAMVQRAHGHISVMSAPAYGTVARVLFPVCDAEASTVDVVTPPRTSQKEKPTLLVVDDDEAVRRVMTRFLRKTGHEVLEASDALVAQEIVRSYKGTIDLLVTDVMMPRVKGTELAEWMVTEHPDAAILLVSGYMDSARIQAWVDKDPDVFLAKPFEPEELLERVRLRLRQR